MNNQIRETSFGTVYYFSKSGIVNLLIAICMLNLLVLSIFVEFLSSEENDKDNIVNSPATYTINGQAAFKSSQSRVQRG